MLANIFDDCQNGEDMEISERKKRILIVEDEKNIVDLTNMEERELLGKEHLDYVAYERRSKRTDSDIIEHDSHV